MMTKSRSGETRYKINTRYILSSEGFLTGTEGSLSRLISLFLSPYIYTHERKCRRKRRRKNRTDMMSKEQRRKRYRKKNIRK